MAGATTDEDLQAILTLVAKQSLVTLQRRTRKPSSVALGRPTVVRREAGGFMGLAETLRALVGQLDGALSDIDDYPGKAGFAAPAESERGIGAGYDESCREEPLAQGRPARERAARPLALVRPPRLEVLVVAPHDFDDARQIADRLRAGGPVIVDLQCCGRELSMRLTDFCSGLTYALEGSLQHIGEQVVLLAPHNVELSSAPPNAPHDRRFYNQA
jgi:FtsZ-interacting cell division protein YlmF